MANPLARLEALLERGAPVAERHLPGSDRIRAELRQKLTTGKLQIMAFGAYNAGKSTMINALLGRAAAEVGEIPTTDAVQAYDWEGHVLLDTPGVNAPVAHEKISRAQLDRTDLIFFILRQEDQDAADIVGRLMELIAAKRPLFILLNGETSALASIEGMRARLLDVLLREARKQGLDPEALERVPMVFLNARTACKARIEGKAKLLEASGYGDFQLSFLEWLRRHEEKTQRLKTIRGDIRRLWLAPTLAALESRAAEPPELRETEAEIRRIRREILNLETSCANRIRAEVAARREEIAALGDRPGASSADLTRIADSIWSGLASWIRREGVRGASAEPADFGALQAQAYEGPPQEGAPQEEAFALRQVSDFARLAVGSHELCNAGFGSGGAAALQGAGAASWVGFARHAALAFSVLAVFVDIGRAQDAEEKHNKRLREQALRQHQWVEDVCARISALLTKTVREGLEAQERRLLEPLEARRAALQHGAADLERDLAAWRALTTDFETFRL